MLGQKPPVPASCLSFGLLVEGNLQILRRALASYEASGQGEDDLVTVLAEVHLASVRLEGLLSDPAARTPLALLDRLTVQHADAILDQLGSYTYTKREGAQPVTVTVPEDDAVGRA